MRQFSDQLSAREYAEYEQQKEMWELGAAHAKEMKHLEVNGKIEEIKARLEASHDDRISKERMKQLEVDLAILEAKWASWIRLPLFIIMLPVRFVVAFAIPISVITKTELPETFWRFMKS